MPIHKLNFMLAISVLMLSHSAYSLTHHDIAANACRKLVAQLYESNDFDTRGVIRKKIKCLSDFMSSLKKIETGNFDCDVDVPEFEQELSNELRSNLFNFSRLFRRLEVPNRCSISERVQVDTEPRKSSLSSQLNGRVIDPKNEKTEWNAGDILLWHIDKTVFPFGHMSAVVNVTKIKGKNGSTQTLLDIIDIAPTEGGKSDMALSTKKFDPKTDLNGEIVDGYRFEDSQLRDEFIDVLQRRDPRKVEYGYKKGMRSISAITNGSPDRNQKIKIIANLIRDRLVKYANLELSTESRGSQSRWHAAMKDAVLQRGSEICSTLISNSLVIALLNTELEKNPHHPGSRALDQELEELAYRILQSSNVNDYDEIIRKAAKRLYANNHFKEISEIDHSPVYQEYSNRMKPKAVMKFLTSFSKNPCQ